MIHCLPDAIQSILDRLDAQVKRLVFQCFDVAVKLTDTSLFYRIIHISECLRLFVVLMDGPKTTRMAEFPTIRVYFLYRDIQESVWRPVPGPKRKGSEEIRWAHTDKIIFHAAIKFHRIIDNTPDDLPARASGPAALASNTFASVLPPPTVSR